MSNTVLEVENITKTFPGVKALDNVDFRLKKGSVHALVGENGAGKSTLMMILGGVYKPDSGKIILGGKEISFDSPFDANKNGISVVYQELSLVPELSIAENIYACRQPINKVDFINWRKLFKQTTDLLKKFEMENLDPRTLVESLSMAKKQVVEILKALSVNPKILILDEPTSSLTEIETMELFDNINKLKKTGISIIYISHHLSELFEIADVVTVLRDGKKIVDKDVKGIDEDFLVKNMTGRTIGNIYGERKKEEKIGETLFETKNLTREGFFKDVSISVKRGEIVGFAGLVGAGRTELGRAIFGVDPITSGEMFFKEKKIRFKNANQAIKSGVGYLTEDRKEQGLYLNFDISENLAANHLNDFTSSAGFLKRKKINNFAIANVDKFNITTPGIHQVINNLSGGNQQKVLVSSWFGIDPEFLIADEPTRGVDVGAKSDIYKFLRKFAASGLGIMVISSDLEEIMGLCDRIYIMREGKVAGELMGREISEEKIISLATGVSSNSREGLKV